MGFSRKEDWSGAPLPSLMVSLRSGKRGKRKAGREGKEKEREDSKEIASGTDVTSSFGGVRVQ